MRRRCGSQSAVNWPTKPIRAIVPIAPGTGADVDVPAGVPSARRTSSASRSSSRTAAARAARSAPPRPPRPIRTATRSSRSPPRTPSRRRSIRTCRYDVTRDFAAVVPFGRMPTALIISPCEGHQDGPAVRRRGQGQARRVHLRLGRGRIDHASDRGAIPAERGDYRPSMCRSAAAASARRWRRAGSISHSRRSRWRCPTCATAGCWRSRSSARDRASALPGRADHARGRLPELRLCALARHVPAGEDAARHRRPAARREPSRRCSRRPCATGSPGSTSSRWP